MTTLKELKAKQMKNPKFKEAYEALEPEFNIIQAMIDARNEQHLTQKELAERTGIAQADISRIENGTRNPSIRMVQRLAKGMGRKLVIALPLDDDIKSN